MSLKTITLDDPRRKRKDAAPILFSLFSDGVAANLTGATVTITVTEIHTRIPIILDGACTNVGGGALDASGRGSFQPTAGQVDYDSVFDVEVQVVLAGVSAHYPTVGYAALEIQAILGYPPTVPSTYNPGSIPAGTGVSGSLLWTPIAEPATPVSGVIEWVDSTTRLLSLKDQYGYKMEVPRGPQYLGNPGMRSYIPNSIGAGLLYMNSESYHWVGDDIAAAQFCFANFQGGSETGPGAAATISASIEYETGRFYPLRFSGQLTGTIPNGGQLWCDPIPWMISRLFLFGVRQWRNCAAGFVYTSNAQDHALGERIEYSAGVLADKTLGGVISPVEVSPWSGPCGIRGLMRRPSVGIIHDSRGAGVGDTTDGTGAIGEFARALQALGIPWQNLSIGGTGANGFLSGGHANRVELASLCSSVIIGYGINDTALGDAQMRADILALAALLPASQKKFLATLAPWTTSTDGWATLGNQSAVGTQAVIAANNAWRLTQPAGFSGVFDINSVTQSGATGKWLAPGYTADGLHETQLGYLAIKNSGLITPASFYR